MPNRESGLDVGGPSRGRSAREELSRSPTTTTPGRRSPFRRPIDLHGGPQRDDRSTRRRGGRETSRKRPFLAAGPPFPIPSRLRQPVTLRETRLEGERAPPRLLILAAGEYLKAAGRGIVFRVSETVGVLRTSPRIDSRLNYRPGAIIRVAPRASRSFVSLTSANRFLDDSLFTGRSSF